MPCLTDTRSSTVLYSHIHCIVSHSVKCCIVRFSKNGITHLMYDCVIRIQNVFDAHIYAICMNVRWIFNFYSPFCIWIFFALHFLWIVIWWNFWRISIILFSQSRKTNEALHLMAIATPKNVRTFHHIFFPKNFDGIQAENYKTSLTQELN